MFPESRFFGLCGPRVCYAPEDGTGTQVPPEPQTFSIDYVKELRGEAKGLRLKVAELEQARKAAEEGLTKVQKDADEKTTAAQQAANDRIIRAEMKAAALKAGMVDLDGLKLADLSKVKLLEDGSLEGADDLMKALKEAKPYLFGSAGDTGHAGKPPPAKDVEAKSATKMTPEEYAAAKKAAGIKA
jgi:ribosomal protein L24